MSQHERQEKQKRDQEELQAAAASSRVGAAHADQLVDEMRNEQFLDAIRETDFDSWLEDELGPEISPVYAIANETQEDYRRHRFLNENRAERVISEHNPGRLCRGPLLELAQGINNKPDKAVATHLSADEKRHIREAESAKTAMQSLGKEARGLRSITEAVTTTRVENENEGSESSGSVRSSLSRIFK